MNFWRKIKHSISLKWRKENFMEDWITKNFFDKCMSLNVEPSYNKYENTLIFRSPVELTESQKTDLVATITRPPDLKIIFKVTCSASTIASISYISQELELKKIVLDVAKNKVTIGIPNDTNWKTDPENFYSMVNQILFNDPYVKEYEIVNYNLKDLVPNLKDGARIRYQSRTIQKLISEPRPERTESISEDDILNLKIILNQTDSSADILGML
jgi:hypothetical protein